jgi:chemotaxis protein MotB
VSKPNQERWLLTYADLITLLMIFFVLMYTISRVDAEKYRAVAGALSETLGSGQSLIGESTGTSLIEMPGNGMDELQKIEEIKRQLDAYIQQNSLGGQVSLEEQERGLVVRFKNTLLFPLASAEITPAGQRVIAQVGKMLAPLPNQILVEGHTCNLQINNAQFHSNWELSTGRATKVVHVLIANFDLPAERLAAVGYGEFRPVAKNDTEEQRAANRRVDIVILKSKYNQVVQPR